MGWDAILTLTVLISAVVLFITEKLSVDVIAMLILASLLVLGLVTPAEALSGFSSEATVTVAAMFILSAGLAQTGAMDAVGRVLIRIKTPWLFLLVLMFIIGPISAFVNNTAAVAVFLPLVLAATAANRQSPSQVLIPLSYAAQMGGVCTLIGTSTNLLVNSLAKDLGFAGFGLFDFAELGFITMLFGFAYLMLVRHWLLPHHPPAPLSETYRLGKYITELRVMQDSPFIGQSAASIQIAKKYKVRVLELIRGDSKQFAPRAVKMDADDILLVEGDWANIETLRSDAKLEIDPEFKHFDLNTAAGKKSNDRVLVEAMVAPGARLSGKTLEELDFKWHHNATVLALHRKGEVLNEKIKDVVLSVGDVMLLICTAGELDVLRRNENLIILEERDSAAVKPKTGKALLSVAIVSAAIAIAALGILPIVASSILGCIALVATRCIGNDQAYQSVDWRVIVLLAGVIPLGVAMQKSGLAQLLADTTVHSVGSFGPLATLAAVYTLTAVLTAIMSNNATAVLITPIAYTAAISLGVSPAPFLVAVLFAASTSFATPIGYQTNTMVYSAGNYRFTDYMRIGIPLNILFLFLALYLIPRFFPF